MSPVHLFWLALAGLVVSASAGAAPLPDVVCHVSYGGETQHLSVKPTRDPYAVAPVAVGSYFLFRVVFEHPARALPGIKIYTYADRDSDAMLIHVAHFPYPPVAGKRFGFTGEQVVYEPMRDGELHYWCELKRMGKKSPP
jgi:hypothetical protein